MEKEKEEEEEENHEHSIHGLIKITKLKVSIICYSFT